MSARFARCIALLAPFVIGCGERVHVSSPDSVAIREEVVIRGDARRVWNVLADLPRYESWNPWLHRAWGNLTPGGQVAVDVKLGEKMMRAEHLVLAVDPFHRLCWRDAGWNAIFVYGQRCRWIEPLPGGFVRLRQEILLEGWLAGFAISGYGNDMRTGLRAETEAIRQRVQRGFDPPR